MFSSPGIDAEARFVESKPEGSLPPGLSPEPKTRQKTAMQKQYAEDLGSVKGFREFFPTGS